MKEKSIRLEPDIGSARRELLDFIRFARRKLKKCQEWEFAEAFYETRASIQSSIPRAPDDQQLKLAVTKSVLLDLIGVGWQTTIRKGTLHICPPNHVASDMHASKAIVRRSHMLERESQLREKSVREFIESLERKRLTRSGWHSIFSVVRDGSELADKLRSVTNHSDCQSTLHDLRSIISPYLEFVKPEEQCKQTGLPLQDIWRYFRHTWVNAYRSLPGRSMLVLVRDAAVANHPVIGIAALGSAVAQQRIRDHWIGWDQDEFMERLRSKPSTRYGKWLIASLDAQIGAVYRYDLSRDRICHSIDLDYPSDEAIKQLCEESVRARDQHRLFPRSADTKSQQAADEVDWEQQARTYLFRSKRCGLLARLLKIRHAFQSSGLKTGVKSELVKALESSSFRSSVRQLIRTVKAEHVGINMLDIIVCGAIPPYNTLLGGKLICMMMCSPEIVHEYSRRYRHSPSIIASSMKGEPVVRDPQLVLLCTTSLFGVGSSQYNRVTIPTHILGGKEGDSVRYKCLGKTEGYGSYHFSVETVRMMDTLLARTRRGRKVNSIFGEGVSPRLRKIREALELIGLPPDELLIHGNRRVVYGISLVRNLRDSLLGLSRKPDYLVPQAQPRKRTEQIVDFWRERWLLNRITRPETLASVSEQTLSYPITHGARVQLPATSRQETFDI